MTWFQSLNPLLVIVLTPILLVRWRRKAEAGREHSPLQKMATGALIGAGAYALLALASATVQAARAGGGSSLISSS